MITECISYLKRPAYMQHEKLRLLEAEPTSFSTLQGIFAAYRHGDIDRKSLVEAIFAWQITEAKKAKP